MMCASACSIRKAEQRPHMRGPGFGERGVAVAAFEGGDDAAFAVAVGEGDGLLGEPAV